MDRPPLTLLETPLGTVLLRRAYKGRVNAYLCYTRRQGPTRTFTPARRALASGVDAAAVMRSLQALEASPPPAAGEPVPLSRLEVSLTSAPHPGEFAADIERGILSTAALKAGYKIAELTVSHRAKTFQVLAYRRSAVDWEASICLTRAIVRALKD